MSTTLALYRPEPGLPALAPSVIEAAALIRSPELPAVSSFPSAEHLAPLLVHPLTGIAFLLGHRNSLKEKDDLKNLAAALAKQVKRRFAGFKVPEIVEALQRGAAGEYRRRPDEVLLPSIDHFLHWLSCYQAGCRAEAIKALAKADELQAAQLRLPPADPFADMPAAVAEMVAMFAHSRSFPHPFDGGGLAWRWLWEVGALRGFKTPDQYARIRADEALKMRRSSSKEQRRHMRSIFEHLRSGQLSPELPLAGQLQSNCRARVLREWIRYHAARRTDMLPWLLELQQAHAQRRQQAA